MGGNHTPYIMTTSPFPPIGRYEIRTTLGKGGMATVYRAFDPQFQREVAIKVLPRELLHRDEFRTRFQREALTIASLEHPAIVPVYDFGEADGQPFLVMRLMAGGSLADRMRNGPLSLTEIARLFNRLAPALDYAHQRGIIHRDLKPGNILFDQLGEPYLADFGIARLRDATTSLTGDGIIGTPAYMSPEQGKGMKNIDRQSDVYALGAMLFEMLTGRPPYESDTPTGQIIQHITDPVPDVRAANPTLPEDCQGIIAQAMAKQPADRYPSVAALAADVDTVARGKSLPKARPTLKGDSPTPEILPDPDADKKTMPVSPPSPDSGRRFGWVGGFLFLVLCLVGGGFLFNQFFPGEPTATPTASPSPTPSLTLTPSPSETASATIPPSQTPSPTPPHTLTFWQTEGLVSVQVGNAEPQLARPGLQLPLDTEVILVSGGKAELQLEEGTHLFLGANTTLTLFAQTEGQETNLLQMGTVLVQAGSWQVHTVDLAYRAQVQDGWMGVTFAQGEFWVDCLSGTCQIGELPLQAGQRAGYTATGLSEPEPVIYETWTALGGADAPTSAPAQQTPSPTPKPGNTLFGSTPTSTKTPKTEQSSPSPIPSATPTIPLATSTTTPVTPPYIPPATNTKEPTVIPPTAIELPTETPEPPTEVPPPGDTPTP